MPPNIEIDEQTGQARNFWAWVVQTPKIPIAITEGAKKAGCLLTAGYVAIALPGIYNGYRQVDLNRKKGIKTLVIFDNQRVRYFSSWNFS